MSSHTHNCTVDTLESFDQRVDPTGTATLRKRYAQKLRGAFDDLITLINQGVRQEDKLGLDIDTDALEEVPDVALSPNQSKEKAFMEWLNQEVDRGILETIDRDDNPYVRSAYRRGLADANQSLQEQGIEVGEIELDEIFAQGVHQRTLQRLYTKNYENLKDVNDVMASQIRDELSRGLAEGINPKDMAANINDRIESVGKHRATVLARTETIDAYSEGTLTRLEDFGVTTVTIRAEILTAGDARVCPLCASIEGETMTTERVRNGSFRYEASENEPDHLTGDWPIKPPLHPSCRCRIIPVT